MAAVEVTPAVSALAETETVEVVKTENTKTEEEVVVAAPPAPKPVITEEPQTADVAAPEEPTDPEKTEAPAAFETKETVIEDQPEVDSSDREDAVVQVLEKAVDQEAVEMKAESDHVKESDHKKEADGDADADAGAEVAPAPETAAEKVAGEEEKPAERSS